MEQRRTKSMAGDAASLAVRQFGPPLGVTTYSGLGGPRVPSNGSQQPAAGSALVS